MWSLALFPYNFVNLQVSYSGHSLALLYNSIQHLTVTNRACTNDSLFRETPMNAMTMSINICVNMICTHLIELFLNSMGLFVGSFFPMIFYWLVRILFQSILSTCACSEVVYELEWRETYYSSLGSKFFHTPLAMPKPVWPSMNRYRNFLFNFHATSKHAPWKV